MTGGGCLEGEEERKKDGRPVNIISRLLSYRLLLEDWATSLFIISGDLKNKTEALRLFIFF